MIFHTGTARIDLSTPTDFKPWCIFECEDRHDLSKPMLKVEMNVDGSWNFHAYHSHEHQTARVPGVAHLDCYSAWYEKTYGVPFTMSA